MLFHSLDGLLYISDKTVHRNYKYTWDIAIAQHTIFHNHIESHPNYLISLSLSISRPRTPKKP